MSAWDAWINVKWKAGAPADAWKKWDLKQVKKCWSTTGEWDCALWVAMNNIDDLEDFVWNNIRKNEWVAHTDAHWVKEWAGQPV